MRKVICGSGLSWGRLLVIVNAALLLSHVRTAALQQPAALPLTMKVQPSPGDKNDPLPDPNGGVSPQSGTSNDRLFYTLPDFLTVQASKLPPLTTGQKFKVVARISFDPVAYPWYGALAGIGQAENSERQYGQGAAGYGKRYGAAFADGTIENFLTGAILPSLLREDPRYYQSGKGTLWRRTGYAISRIFVTRTDAGHERFNFSEIVGSALSAGITTYSYHPRGDRNFPNAASVWGSMVGYDTLTIVVTEFWPDIRRKLSHKPRAESFAP